MKISSASTYLLPFLLLFLTIFWITGDWSIEFFGRYFNDMYAVIGTAVAGTVLCYLALRKLVRIVNVKYIKIVICILPFILQNIFEAVYHPDYFTFRIFLPALFSAFLYLSFFLLDERYTATLSEGSIKYCNLFGQAGEIPLQSITKLEQKKNMLSFFIKEFKLMDITRKTCIAFCDENMDEYEINFFCPVFRGKEVFEKIIAKSTELGNHKIRQYEI